MDKRTLDGYLQKSLSATAQEVGELLGLSFDCSWKPGRLTGRDEYLTGHTRKMILTTVEVSGDRQGLAYLVTGHREAITLGGTLIMLPGEELQRRVRTGGFDGEAADAFGEVVNIIAGAFTTVAGEAFTERVHLKKTLVTTISPGEETGLPDQGFYVSSSQLTLDGEPLGQLDILFPTELFALPWPIPSESEFRPAPEPASLAPTEVGSEKEGTVFRPPPGPAPADLQGEESAPLPVVLVIAASREEASGFAPPADGRRYDLQCLATQDNLREELRGRTVALAFLVMREVGELGFGACIKIKATLGEQVPLIAAGPQWTRSTVLQAVKYGARDILITPAAPEEVQEKIERVLVPPPRTC